jgi:aarF domain-containing kinase
MTTIFASILGGHTLQKSRFARGYPLQIMTRRNYALLSSRVTRLSLPIVGGLTWDGFKTTYCETLAVSEPGGVTLPMTETIIVREPHGQQCLQQRIRHVFRLWRRFIKLLITLTPVAALYPLQKLLKWTKSVEQERAHDALMSESDEVEGPLGWYLNMCLYCVESSGAAVVKLMQWAGSRPDLFGQDFCAVFSRLQDDTTPHSWGHTERVMKEAYGDDWEQNIHLGKVVGSGCIGQVYEGTVKDANGKEQRVAVKVLHPNVEEDIDSDLELLRTVAYYLDKYEAVRGFRYLNVEGAIDEFSSLLKLQLDLQTEAYNLVRFNENFANVDDVTFPKLVEGYKPSKDILIMTYCDGIPILQFARENKDNPEMLSTMCKIGINSICKMIFEDNFLHGDLHPGNVLISTEEPHKFIVLDVGMVTEYSDADHRLIVDVLTSFIRKNGRRAGELLVADTNARNTHDQAVAEELYIEKIEALTARAHEKNFFMQQLGTYISYICEAAATHHVMMNQAFVSAALAVKIQEGIALALDPNVSIYRVANPIILQVELKRRLFDMAYGIKKSILGKTN